MAEQEKKSGSKVIGISLVVLTLLVLAVIIIWATK